ncbi:MAG: hypothetical protein ABDH25_01230 [Dictyoglomaceae bacterium]
MKKVILIFILFFLFLNPSLSQINRLNTIRVHGYGNLDERGNLNFSIRWVFPTNALYLQVKSAYPNPYVLMRNLLGFSSIMELRNVKVSYDDAKNSIVMSANIIGASVYRRQRWELNIGKNSELIYNDTSKAIFLFIESMDEENIMIQTLRINLPKDSKDLSYDSKTGIFSYNIPRKENKGKTNIDVQVKVKPRIMSSLYKVYGMPEVLNGSYWVAKFIFENKGTSDILDLKISYKLGDYSGWSPESVYNLVVPGGAVVDLYYPIISSNITQLKSQTPVDLQIKYSYKDIMGKTYNDNIVKRIQILGINQFEFSNIPEEERTGEWLDNFSNIPLIAAFVTKLDDPIKAFAGLVSQYSGGVAASSNDEDAEKFCRALYELSIYNGISYQTPSGFLVSYSTGGQDIKFPRDVLRDKAGTCIDLAILFSAVCEAVGLNTVIVVTPGHAFPVIILPSGNILPIESTGLGGAVVGKSLPFEEAVKLGYKNLNELKLGRYFSVRVWELQRMGIIPPELSPLQANIIKDWGYKLPEKPALEVKKPVTLEDFGLQPTPSTPSTPAPSISNLSGTYQGRYTNNNTGQQGTIELQLRQSGNNLSGRILIDNVDEGNVTGSISGNNIVLNAQIDSIYGEYNVIFRGTLQGNIIQGNYTIQGYNVGGSFYLTKVR